MTSLHIYIPCKNALLSSYTLFPPYWFCFSKTDHLGRANTKRCTSPRPPMVLLTPGASATAAAIRWVQGRIIGPFEGQGH